MLKPLPFSNTHGKYWEFQRTPGPKAFTIFHLSFTLHGERRGSPRRRWRELLPASVFTICSVDPNRMTHDCWVRNIQPYRIVISCHIKPEIIYANMLILQEHAGTWRQEREPHTCNFPWLFLAIVLPVYVVHTSTPFLLPSRHPAWLRHGHSPWQCWHLVRIQHMLQGYSHALDAVEYLFKGL